MEGEKLESEANPKLQTCANGWKRVTVLETEMEGDLRDILNGIKLQALVHFKLKRVRRLMKHLDSNF